MQAMRSKSVLQGHHLTPRWCIRPKETRSCPCRLCQCMQLCGRRCKDVLCPREIQVQRGLAALGAKAARQAADNNIALLISSSVIEQHLYHLLSLNTWRWASQCLSPTSVHLSFCVLVFAESRNV